MKLTKLFIACAITLAVAHGPLLMAQVQTNIPDLIPGAKPVAVEHIQIHGAALKDNLEGDAVDRDESNVAQSIGKQASQRPALSCDGIVRIARCSSMQIVTK